jgi:hypothetical protein
LSLTVEKSKISTFAMVMSLCDEKGLCAYINVIIIIIIIIIIIMI